ncbi:MAG: TatD family deoxyribonuclease, partial [Planctomycetota bacterium]
MHSFSGDQATAEACLEIGMHISFAGMVTYKKSDELRAVAAMVPSDRILVETDAPYLAPVPNRGKRNEPGWVRHTAESPYLAPVPNRGKRNEPGWVRHTAECLADVRGVTPEEFAAQTTENAVRLFALQQFE